jgi:hypothetical protein
MRGGEYAEHIIKSSSYILTDVKPALVSSRFPARAEASAQSLALCYSITMRSQSKGAVGHFYNAHANASYVSVGLKRWFKLETGKVPLQIFVLTAPPWTNEPCLVQVAAHIVSFPRGILKSCVGGAGVSSLLHQPLHVPWAWVCGKGAVTSPQNYPLAHRTPTMSPHEPCCTV